MSLEGKHAMVTGAGGIGGAVAALLAGAGARVSVVSRSAARVTPVATAPFFRAQADVTIEAQVHAAFEACRAANGPIAVLVNNAGIAESAPIARTTRAMWDRIIATNLTGTFVCTREVLAEMMAAGWGRIVNVASTAGLAGAPYVSAYCASKHGVVGFTRAVAAELARSAVTVNAICPGYTEGEMLTRTVSAITAKTGRTQAQARALMAQFNPGGRFATADEVGQGVLALIEEGARTGVALVIPGGATA